MVNGRLPYLPPELLRTGCVAQSAPITPVDVFASRLRRRRLDSGAGPEQNKNMTRAQYEVRRYVGLDGRTLFFAVFLGTRSRGWRTFRPGEVPEFDGDAATFEVSVVKGRWLFGRRLR